MTTPLARVRRGAIFLAVVVALAVSGYKFLDDRTWIDALYLVVTTIAAIGFGEHSDFGPGMQLYTLAVIVLGISAAAYTIGGLFQMITEGEIERALGMRRTTKEIQKLSGHVIICGFGRIGQILAAELRRHGQSLIVVDHNPETAAEAEAEGYLVLKGDASEEEVLLSAGVERAHSLVTALPNDAANVFITLTSRNVNKALQIIARAEHHSSQKKLIQAGANRVVLPAAIGARRIAAMLVRPTTLELMDLVTERTGLNVEIDELTIPAGSKLVGATVVEAEARRKHGILIVAVKQAAGAMVFNPDTDQRFAPGDTLIVMGGTEDIQRFRQAYQV